VDEKEEALLANLRDEYNQQIAEIRARAQQAPEDGEPTAFPTQSPRPDAEPEHTAMLNPVFASREAPSEGNYYFYQPVYWQKSCISCHEGYYGKYAIAASDTALSQPAELPFLVIRIALPYREARSAINYTHAVLLSIGMLTVVTSMIALYYIVKYIIVKPLDHLCSVSDAVTRGDLGQRADIHTNDEFEELAASFNKMLRHLTEAQVDLQRINTDLDAKVDQLAQLNMRLHEMNRLKGEFLANMSHELRTPLNSIIGFSEVLAGIDSLNERQKRYANNIQKSGRILLDMINDILDLAKLEAGKMELRLSEFRLDAIIHAQCDMVRSLTEDKNIDLAVEVDGDLPPLFQDQSKVQQILNNLLSNAIKFTPEGGRITVGAKGHPRGMVEMFVADTGVGIAESDREVIFEKFRQGTVLGRDNLTREHSGTGLGLSIVKELCKLLGGEVTVESELGKGSTFRVLIPWMKADAPQAAAKINNKLDDLTKPRRTDFQRLHDESEVATS
jgi:signal transduction histidine kinase